MLMLFTRVAMAMAMELETTLKVAEDEIEMQDGCGAVEIIGHDGYRRRTTNEGGHVGLGDRQRIYGIGEMQRRTPEFFVPVWSKGSWRLQCHNLVKPKRQ